MTVDKHIHYWLEYDTITEKRQTLLQNTTEGRQDGPTAKKKKTMSALKHATEWKE